MSESVFDLGDIARVTAAFTDDDGNPVDQTDLTVTVRAPDGTVTHPTGSIIHDGEGAYHLDLEPDQEGTWLGKFDGDSDTVPFTFEVRRDYTAPGRRPIMVGTPAQFATAADFAARMGETLTDAEEARADTLLTLASTLIQEVVKQKIALIEGDVLTMPGTVEDRIALPERPVVSVDSVMLDEVALTEGSDWYLDGATIYRRAVVFNPQLGLIDGPFLLGSGFGTPLQTLTITYTHGYDDDEIPGTVKAICLEAVVRCFVNPGAVARETVGNTSTVYDNMRFSPSGLLLTDDERRTLKRLFGSRSLSVPVA